MSAPLIAFSFPDPIRAFDSGLFRCHATVQPTINALVQE
jgi:hypothetical protein